MLRALEKDLFLKVDETNKKNIIKVFQLAKTIQLPVIEDEKVAGILDLFTFLDARGRQVDIRSIMDTQVVIAGISDNVFLFSDSKQFILPFVDEEGNYIGFVNRIMQKCYLPSQEYMQVMQDSASSIDYQNIDELRHTYDFILESNYDGIYVTTGKGKTLSINDHCEYVNNISTDDIGVCDDNLIISVDENRSDDVRVVQKVQERNEVSVSDDVLSDGGIVRIINNFHTFRKELQEARELIDKYENELQFLRLEKSKTADIVANSYEMKRIINLVLRISKVDSTVLIEGHSGVGKGVISKLIHNNSQRKDKAFIKIDCSSIPESLIESELFGYEQGAFTGAQKGGKVGLIEMANEGTLFLDEIGELPLNMQTKLLSVLQDKEIRRVGSGVSIPVNVRILAATNCDLSEMVKEGRFRSDLYYRLNVVPIKIPPLCDRREDIKPLIENCLSRFNNKYGFNKNIEPKAMKILIDYSWPGNVRELENLIEFLVVTSDSDIISTDIIPESIYNNRDKISLGNVSSMKDAVRLVEIEVLLDAMKKANSMEDMAKILKLDRTTVSRKMQKYNIKPNFENE